MDALIGAAALPVAAALLWALLHSPLRRRLVAVPTGERWHAVATPSFGGVGIFAGAVAGVLLAVASGALDWSGEIGGILGGMAILFVAGLVDDVRSLPPLVKVAAQVGAAATALTAGVQVQVVHDPVAAALLGGFWIVAMTNAFNLLDNMDGLAASLAGIACVYFAIDAVTIHPDRLSLVVSIAVAAACLGFLPYNLRPTRKAVLFMGDSGSQMLGFTVGVLGLLTSWKVAETTVATFFLPLLILAVPILDTALVTVVRLVEGRPVTQGGRDHTSHRLVYRGLSEQRAVVVLALISAGLGGTSLAYTVIGNTWIALVGVLLTFAMLVQFAGFLAEDGRAPAPGDGREHTLLVRQLLLQRGRIVELLIDFALISASLFAAYLLRVSGTGTVFQKAMFEAALPVVLVARFVVFIPLGLYRSVWRYAGSHDAARIAVAVVLSEGLAVGYLAFTRTTFGDFGLDIFVIDAILCTIVIGAARFAERALERLLSNLDTRGHHRRTLIVGAGRGGRSLVRELRETPGELVVGFVDDDPRLRRRRLLGVPVLGGTGELERVLRATHPDAVLVSIPTAPREVLDAVVAASARADVPCRFVRRELDLDPLVVLGAATK